MTGPQEPKPYSVVARNIDPTADNRIHDDDVARRFGFSGALVPGVELFAYATAPLVAAWGADWLSGGTVSVRFRRPVYDGERVTVRTSPDGRGQYDLVLEGPDGTARTVGAASAPVPQLPLDLGRFPATPLPGRLRAPDPAALGLGPFGTVDEPCTAEANAQYCDAVEDSQPLYCDAVEDSQPLYRDGAVHPGLLLRRVNAALMRNVDLGPWIHTASDCRMLAVARTPCTLSVRSVVTGLSQRNGHEVVRYDAVVLSDGVPVMATDHRAIYRLAADPGPPT